jgi:hypothetical protein
VPVENFRRSPLAIHQTTLAIHATRMALGPASDLIEPTLPLANANGGSSVLRKAYAM